MIVEAAYAAALIVSAVLFAWWLRRPTVDVTVIPYYPEPLGVPLAVACEWAATVEPLPGNKNGAVSYFLTGAHDATEMERLLNARVGL